MRVYLPRMEIRQLVHSRLGPQRVCFGDTSKDMEC